jgi:hypothetical protein
MTTTTGQTTRRMPLRKTIEARRKMLDAFADEATIRAGKCILPWRRKDYARKAEAYRRMAGELRWALEGRRSEAVTQAHAAPGVAP